LLPTGLFLCNYFPITLIKKVFAGMLLMFKYFIKKIKIAFITFISDLNQIFRMQY